MEKSTISACVGLPDGNELASILLESSKAHVLEEDFISLCVVREKTVIF